MEPPACPLEVSVTEADAWTRSRPSEVQIIDVREPRELVTNHVAGAEHIPMRLIPERVATLPRDRHLLILCHHGQRSLVVTHFLRAQGFPAVSNIAGGIEAWARQLDPAMRRY